MIHAIPQHPAEELKIKLQLHQSRLENLHNLLSADRSVREAAETAIFYESRTRCKYAGLSDTTHEHIFILTQDEGFAGERVKIATLSHLEQACIQSKGHCQSISLSDLA